MVLDGKSQQSLEENSSIEYGPENTYYDNCSEISGDEAPTSPNNGRTQALLGVPVVVNPNVMVSLNLTKFVQSIVKNNIFVSF